MYSLYPLGLVAGILLWFVMNHMDKMEELDEDTKTRPSK